MTEVVIGAHTYHIGKLKPRFQRNLLRRMLPLLPAMRSAAGIAQTQLGPLVLAGPEASEIAQSIAQELDAATADAFAEALGPLATAIGAMSDADCDYIFDTCFSVCQRKVATSGYQPIMAGGELRYEDILLPDQLRLTFYVLKENLMGFSFAPPGP